MEQVISDAVKRLFGETVDVTLTRPAAQFGDYATNTALQLAKKIGRSPREIAEEIAAALRDNEEFSDVSVAGPGFINLKVNNVFLAAELEQMVDNPHTYGQSRLYEGKTVVTEYSDPNPFKVLHVGHLYTSIIGDAVSNLIEAAGGTVHRVNFGGDVGLHVGKTMWAILEELKKSPDILEELEPHERSEWMARCYVAGTNAYEDDEAARKEIILLNKKVYQLHNENDRESDFAQIYWRCRGWSYDYFKEFYARIGTRFEKFYPESETAPIGLQTVREQKENGVYVESEGATVFVGEPYGLHTRVFINSDGLPTYEAKDVGLSIKKWEDYHFDESVIITGNDIAEYMKVVLKSIEQFKPELAARTKHFTHGNVKLAGGVKMSSRKGNFLRAVDVLEMTADANEKARKNRDEAPVLGAIKYAFLKNRVGGDIIFEPSESVSIHGNSGPYLQYALTRARAVLTKLVSDPSGYNTPPDTFDEYERALLFKMTEYKTVVHDATADLAPHQLCTYLYELAQTFNRFYEKRKVIGDEREAVRWRLVSAYFGILEDGLKKLGIPTPETM